MTDYMPPAFAEHFETVPPDVLHHYTGQTGLLGIVERAEMWCTKVQYMNDATEFGLALDMARKRLVQIQEELEAEGSDRSSANGKIIACVEFHRSLDGLEHINLFAACFCEDGDLLSQWRGYAGGSHGYAIRFDTEMLQRAVRPNGFTLGKCIYDTDIQREIVEQAIHHCLDDELAIPSRSRWGGHGPLADILFRCGVFFKEPSFAEEKEWRLVSPTIMFHNERLEFRSGRSMITPYYS
ncbi:MAG TPA: DUF2971 domain-containing protein, partial [Candidatus Acidoferrum sp.]|nr:DUF2971 domain-containing protein [Candidatus Acidoferrum sp.]